MAVPFFWRTTGERNTDKLINQFEQTLEDCRDEETDVEEEQTSISKEDEAILKEGGVIGIIEIPSIDIRYPVMEGTGSAVLGNWLNGRMSGGQIEQLWCELVTPKTNNTDKESEE